MEAVELRDFALEAAQRQIAAAEADEEHLKRQRSQGGRLRRFWTTHVRITISEQECRDHLALERTFLAYVRTASAYAQFGVTLAQLFRLNTSSNDTISTTTLKIAKALGATTEGVAIIVILLGAAYFAKQQTGLMQGTTIARGYEIVVMLIISFVLLCILLGLLAGNNSW